MICQPKRLAHCQVDPGVPIRDAAALFDHVLLPSSHPFCSGPDIVAMELVGKHYQEEAVVGEEVTDKGKKEQARRTMTVNSVVGNPLETMSDSLLKAAELARQEPRGRPQGHPDCQRSTCRSDRRIMLYTSCGREGRWMRRPSRAAGGGGIRLGGPGRECIEHAYRDGRKRTPIVRSLTTDGVPCSD
eukprot:3194366-Pyramimonas_sp.AAC.1